MDIVELLRDDTKYCQCSFMDIYKPIEMEAADEIERLRKALKEIVKRDAGVNKFGEKDMSTLGWIAYNALGEKE